MAITRLTLSVFETNRRAQGLYERAGFVPEMRRYVKQLVQARKACPPI